MKNLVFEVDDTIFSKNLQVMIVDKHGKIVLFNRANEELDNLKREDVIGRHITEVFQLDEQNSANLRVLKDKKPVVDLYQDYTTKSGHRVISVSSAYPLVQNGEFMGALTITKNIYRFKKLMDIISGAEKHDDEKPVINSENVYTFGQITGKSRALMNCIHIARKAANVKSSIMIYGETGTGKELFAQSVHHASGRKGPFISLNCAAVPETLLESILFGTAKGAFTGAIERRGLFEEANNGTLFLDEINSMNFNQQAKLLRVLETGRIRKIGENKEREVDVRVLSALNISPIEAVEQGTLRRDLFYRLSVVNIRVPPLRERKDDIPLLTKSFIDYYNNLLNCKVKDVTPEVAEMFMQYDWPGNVRELKHVIEYAMNMVEDEEIIGREHLSALFNEQVNQYHSGESLSSFDVISKGTKTGTLKDIVEAVEKETIKEVLQEVNGNVNKAARKMGLSRQNLDYKLKKYQIRF